MWSCAHTHPPDLGPSRESSVGHASGQPAPPCSVMVFWLLETRKSGKKETLCSRTTLLLWLMLDLNQSQLLCRPLSQPTHQDSFSTDLSSLCRKTSSFHDLHLLLLPEIQSSWKEPAIISVIYQKCYPISITVAAPRDCVGHAPCTNISQDLDQLIPESSDLRLKWKGELKGRILLAGFLEIWCSDIFLTKIFSVYAWVHYICLLLWSLDMLDVKGWEEALPRGKERKQVIPTHTVEISGLPRHCFILRHEALSKHVRIF